MLASRLRCLVLLGWSGAMLCWCSAAVLGWCNAAMLCRCCSMLCATAMMSRRPARLIENPHHGHKPAQCQRRQCGQQHVLRTVVRNDVAGMGTVSVPVIVVPVCLMTMVVMIVMIGMWFVLVCHRRSLCGFIRS